MSRGCPTSWSTSDPRECEGRGGRGLGAWAGRGEVGRAGATPLRPPQTHTSSWILKVGWCGVGFQP